MSLIRKSNSTSSQVPSQLIGSLSRGLRAAVPTMDRRTFLKRSGIGVGAGIAATQLNMLQKANAADPKTAMLDGKGKIEVKRTVCSHCSVGCSFDATVENGVWVRQPLFQFSSLVHQSTTTSKLICFVSSFRSTVLTTPTTRHVFATPPQLRVLRIHGVMVR